MYLVFILDTCLIHLPDYIKSQNDKSKYAGMALLDLHKAFDTVDYCTLLSKLQALGFDHKSRDWSRSYLTDRQQLVDLGGTFFPLKYNL